MKFSQTIPIMQGIAQFSTVFCNEPSFQLSVSCRDVDPTLTLKLYSRWRDLSVCRQACLARAIANTNNEEQGTHTCICCAGYNKTAAWALTDPGRGAVLATPNWSLTAHFDLAGVWVAKVRYWPERSAYAAWLSIYDLASLYMDQLTLRFINVAIAIAQVGFALGKKKVVWQYHLIQNKLEWPVHPQLPRMVYLDRLPYG